MGKNISFSKSVISIALSLLVLITAGASELKKGQIQWLIGEFTITDFTKIYAEAGNKEAIAAAGHLIDQLQPATGLRWRPIQTSSAKPIAYGILITSQNITPEIRDSGYNLQVDPRSVVIRARTEQGLINGAQHFLRLLPKEINRNSMQGNVRWAAPAISVIQPEANH